MNKVRRIEAWLLDPVDNSPLVVFRLLFGLLLTAETAGAIMTGWVRRVLIEPEFTFPVLPFTFLQPLPGPWMYVFFAVMAGAGLLVAAGAWFRASLGLFTLMWTTVYLMQTSSYNNHYYLLVLLCLLLLSTPANADLSIDARRDPGIRRSSCPRWCLTIFVLQTALVYLYAAVAKLDLDWLRARPMEIWLHDRRDYFLLGPLYDTAWMPPLLAWGGLLFDAAIVPILLVRRTRFLGVGLAVFFHLFNSYTFRIGVFPYLAMSLLVFFFPGEDIRRWFLRHRPPPSAAELAPRPVTRGDRRILAVLGAYFIMQLLLPLQHWMYAGNVNWTEEGQRMAWRMMLRSKDGTIYFNVTDPSTGKTWKVYPSTRMTAKQADRLPTRPDMIWQFVQRLKREYHEQGIDSVEIRAVSRASLNGRPWQPLVKPDYDLAKAEWHYLRSNEWIEPLHE